MMNETVRKLIVVGNVMSLFLNFILLIMLAAIGTYLNSKFERIFADFEFEISGLTKICLSIPKSFWYYPLLIVIAVGLILKERLVKSPVVNFVLNKTFFVLVLTLMIVYLVAMLGPMYSLQHEL